MRAPDNAQNRRDRILSTLGTSKSPITASYLARQFHVSRQIIVGDIALLRASGTSIVATPRGYMLEHAQSGICRRIACRHNFQGMEEELNLLVDNGCFVEDVIVEHPVYGELTGQLRLTSRRDVQEFMDRVLKSDALPLSDLTGGIHLHTIRFPDEETYDRVLSLLQDKGFLIS